MIQNVIKATDITDTVKGMNNLNVISNKVFELHSDPLVICQTGEGFLWTDKSTYGKTVVVNCTIATPRQVLRLASTV